MTAKKKTRLKTATRKPLPVIENLESLRFNLIISLIFLFPEW